MSKSMNHNNEMTDTRFQQMLTDLQANVAYLELTVDSLDAVIAKQDKQIRDMQRQLQLMYIQLNKPNDTGVAPFDVNAEIPPHY